MSEQIDNAPLIDSEAPVVEPVLPSVGSILRVAREGRGLQTAEIAQALKLGQRQVEALERDEWDGLPGPTFIRGFVRNYARLVGVDAGPLMDRLTALLDKPVDTLTVPAAPPTRISGSSRSRDGLVVGIGALLLSLAALAYFLLPSDLTALRDSLQGLLDGEAKPAEVVPAPASQEPLFPPGSSADQVIAPQAEASADAAVPAGEAQLPVAPATPSAASASPQAVAADVATPPQLRFVVSKESWIEVRDRDGAVVFSQRLAAGSEQQVGGKGPLSVAIGYAPGVTLHARGQIVNLQPHTRGDVARLVLE